MRTIVYKYIEDKKLFHLKIRTYDHEYTLSIVIIYDCDTILLINTNLLHN